MDIGQQIQQSINQVQVSTEVRHKRPLCARCHKDKETRKHHFPLGSRRMAPLCNSCYYKVKKQRNRAKKFGF